MSSKNSPQNIFLKAAADAGDQAYRKAYEYATARRGARAGADRRMPGLADLAGERAASAGDVARQVARLVLRTAIAVAEDVVEGAGQLESVLAGQPADDSNAPPPDDEGGVATMAAAAVLPAVSPGRTTSVSVTVRNASPDTVDAMRLRCGGLHGSGDVRIPGHHVKFAPVQVDVVPRGTADVTCTVNVPADAKRGHYTGLIEATGLTGVQLLVSLDVE
jgi:hypothetical protein